MRITCKYFNSILSNEKGRYVAAYCGTDEDGCAKYVKRCKAYNRARGRRGTNRIDISYIKRK